MANLTVTIISIALVAVAAIMGAFYGGTAFEQGQIDAIANSIISESGQILAASRLWAANNNQSDLTSMPSSTNGYGVWVADATNSGISLLVKGKELSQWPSLAGSMGGPAFTSPAIFQAGPAPNTGSVTTGSYDYGCYNYGGYVGIFWRQIFSYNGGNYISYLFGVNYPAAANCQATNGFFYSYSGSLQVPLNHPIVQIAISINNHLKQIPATATATSVTNLPRPPSGSYYGIGGPSGIGGTGSAQVVMDANGNIQTNYCFFAGVTQPTNASSQAILCTFGPS